MKSYSIDEYISIGFLKTIKDLEMQIDNLCANYRTTLLRLVHNKESLKKISIELNYPSEINEILCLINIGENETKILNSKKIVEIFCIGSVNVFFKINTLIKNNWKLFNSSDFNESNIISFIQSWIELLNEHVKSLSEDKLKLITKLQELSISDPVKYSNLLFLVQHNTILKNETDVFKNNIKLFLKYMGDLLVNAFYSELDRYSRKNFNKELIHSKDEAYIKEYLVQFNDITKKSLAIQFSDNIFAPSKFDEAYEINRKVIDFVKKYQGHVSLQQNINQVADKTTYFLSGICYGASKYWLTQPRSYYQNYNYFKGICNYDDLHDYIVSKEIILHQINQLSQSQSLQTSDFISFSMINPNINHGDVFYNIYGAINSLYSYAEDVFMRLGRQEIKVQLIFYFKDDEQKNCAHAIALRFDNQTHAQIQVLDVNLGIFVIDNSLILIDFINKLLTEFYSNESLAFKVFIMQQKPKIFMNSNYAANTLSKYSSKLIENIYNSIKFNHFDFARAREFCTKFASKEFYICDINTLTEGLLFYDSIKNKTTTIDAIYISLLFHGIELSIVTDPKGAAHYLGKLNKILSTNSLEQQQNELTLYYCYTLLHLVFLHNGNTSYANLLICKIKNLMLNESSKLLNYINALADFCDKLSAYIGQLIASPNSDEMAKTFEEFIINSKDYFNLLKIVKCTTYSSAKYNYANNQENLNKLYIQLFPYQKFKRVVNNSKDLFFSQDCQPCSHENSNKMNVLLTEMLEITKYFKSFLPFWVMNELEEVKYLYPYTMNDEVETNYKLKY